VGYVKRSGLKEISQEEGRDIDILLLDTMGELPSLMGSANVVFIGGSLVKGIGGHNVLEAAAVGKAPLFGPYMGNFPEISKDLVDFGGGFEVASAGEMADTAERLMEDKDFAKRSGERALSVIERNRGAVESCVGAILPFVAGAGGK
jgi:3-deoxy-D-manno-octulosonic-acid transferase